MNLRAFFWLSLILMPSFWLEFSPGLSLEAVFSPFANISVTTLTLPVAFISISLLVNPVW